MPGRRRRARSGKYKGHGEQGASDGLGRLRRASMSKAARLGNLERLAADEDLLASHEGLRRVGHTGDDLLHRFNRLARSTAAGEGIEGVVSGFDGNCILVRDGLGRERACLLRKLLKKMLRGEHSPLCIGDRVRFVTPELGDSSITAILPRENQLERSDSHNQVLVHVFAANIDLLVIVSALAEPELKTGLIDRYLVIAHAAGIEPVIVLNKCDLGDPESARRLYTDLGYEVFTTVSIDGDLVDDGTRHDLLARLAGRSCVFAGQSGVGKSSLVQGLFPEAGARIGRVSTATSKGRHTTNASRSYLLTDATVLIDTPGIRECGLSRLEPIDVALRYRDIGSRQPDCRYPDCTHTHEPDCAVKAAVEAGVISPSRYQSYLSILSEDLGLEI